jgi:hypothetical protein
MSAGLIEGWLAVSSLSAERPKSLGQYVRTTFCALVAILSFSVGDFQRARIDRLESSGVHVVGEVIELRAIVGPKGGTTYSPIVAFRTKSQVSVEFDDKFGTNPSLHYKGESVNVLYSVDDPLDAIVDDGFWWNRARVGIPLFLSAAFFVGAIVSWRAPKKRENNEDNLDDELGRRTRVFLQNTRPDDQCR